MRQLLSCVLIGAVASIASGCAEPAASAVRPRPSGEFRVLVPARPSTLNPDVELDEVAIVIGRSVFSQLLALNEGGRLLPELAESWTTSADGLTYTFKLREGVRWHDGVPFTSSDVRWTLETVARHGFGKDALAPVESIATPDAATVVISLKHPWAPFATDMAGPGLAILPCHLYDGRDWRTHPANQAPVGTGPFKFVGWTDDQRLVLDANPQYFRSGPYVQRVIFEVATPDVAREKLLRGEADYSVGRAAAIDLTSGPSAPLAMRSLPTNGRIYLAMNLRRAPFTDVRVRRALASAIDRLGIVRASPVGLGAPAMGWYTPDVEWAYNPAALVPEHDRAAATRLLDAAGLRAKDGRRFEITLVAPNATPVREIATLLREQLAAVGIGVHVERLTPSDWVSRIIVARDFDVTLVAGTQGPDPDQLRRRFLADTETGSFIGYNDPDFRAAVERGARVVDLAERAAAYYRAQEILARDVPFIPLAESVKNVVYNRRVSGLPQFEARGLVGTFDFSLVKLGAVAPAPTQ